MKTVRKNNEPAAAANDSSGRMLAKMVTTSRNTLTLQKKYEVLDMVKKNPQMSVRKLAEHFSCGKSQIAAIIKNKESIFELYESNLLSESIHFRKRARTSEYVDINEALHKWYLLTVSRNIYTNGPHLCEKAKEIAESVARISEFQSLKWMAKQVEKKIQLEKNEN